MSFNLALKRALLTGAAAFMLLGLPGGAQAQDRMCERTVTANVVALNQEIWLNRLGANIPDGMMYALARDVVDSATGQSCNNGVGSTPPVKCTAGKVRLRDGKRPRPIVLRANEGDCLKIVFTNLLPAAAGSAPGPLAAAAEDVEEGAQELAGNRAQREDAVERGRLRRAPGELLERRPSLEAEAEDAAAGPSFVLPTTRAASVHVQGLPWVNGAQDDGSYVGANRSSLAQPGQTVTYTLFAEHEGSYLLYSTADAWSNPNLFTTGGADGGSLAQGLFGSVNVQPSESDIKPYVKKWDSEWYRSQVTEQDLCLASKGSTYSPTAGCTRQNPGAPPVIDYQALYPANYKEASRANLPILNMLCTAAAVQKGACGANEIVHTDLTAVITGPGASNFPSTILPADQPPALRAITTLPDRLQPYRELTIIYHESFTVQQAFPSIYANGQMLSLASAADNFGINYGMGGIVSEILANRIGVGPMKDCTECKYEEFFLSSWTVGDPAMVVDKPATDCVDSSNKPIANCRADFAKYPSDPSNVYQSYIGDHVRFRVLHGGSDLHHVHHQHAHQWLHTPNSPTADYTDSQSIGPGSSFTMEMTYYGGGNLNQTVGDSIFHCHFYAHFASGMWSMFRTFDTLQTGTVMNGDKPAAGSRALPDGEIIAGTPIPAVVPMPTLPMAPLPAPVRLTNNGTQVEVQLVESNGGTPGPWVNVLNVKGGDPNKTYRNPGYPFFIPGIGGRRAPHPPLDFAYACSDNGMRCSPGTAGDPKDLSLCQNPSNARCEPLDGGLPRHLISGGTAKMPGLNNTDFSKILEESDALQLAEDGTFVEKIAMKTHSQRLTPSCRPDGSCTGVCLDNGAPCTTQPGGLWQCGNPASATCDTTKQVTYVLNGLPPKPGAPYADPCIKFDRRGGPAPDMETRRYMAADIQLDAVFNKEGWHFPQQRMISLWGDVKDFLDRKRPPEPLFFRANSNDCIEYTLANLVSNVYELDDFQVRTPTDILGQHIHLVKFDVTSSDGAGNGWNYEDGTFAPNEVTERIHSINAENGIDTQYVGGTGRKKLTPKPIQLFGNGPGGTWIGAQATIQRWYSDPLWDNAGACSNDPNLACTIIDLSQCRDPKATCDVTAGFCSTNMQKKCTASTAAALCGSTGECISKHDRTLRTVFTHDHFGPSTHQQAGLYAGLVVEPKGSVWRNNQTGEIFGGFDNATGQPVNKRFDGGPTSWQAVIQTQDPERSYREFLLELQDSTLTYLPFAVREFNLDSSSQAAQAQFAPNSFEQHCSNRQPWEPCGFCGSSGRCVNSITGQLASPAQSCTVPATAMMNPQSNPALNPCPSGQSCRLVPGQLVACTPENFDHCAGLAYGDASTQPLSTIKSCKLVSGVPAIAFGTTAVNPPTGGKTPEIITFFGATTNFSFNYRNEPLYPRTTNAFTGSVLSGNAGDLSFAYSSRVTRPSPLGSVCSGSLGLGCNPAAATPCPPGAGTCQVASFCSDNYALCTVGTTGNPGDRTLCGNPATAQCNQTSPYPPLTPDVQSGDPFTPLLRAYAGDDIQVRTLTGAHLNPHNFTIQGMNWLMEPSFVDSGWRNSEVMGISEHFELISRIPALSSGPADFLYQPGAASLEQAGGNWGLVRAYDQSRPDLFRLPQNSAPAAKMAVCPGDAPVRSYNVIALTTQQALGGALSYNDAIGLADSNAVLFFNTAGPIVKCSNPTNASTCALAVTCNSNRCSNNAQMACGSATDCVEPLVLRANAGDCIKVSLFNGIPSTTAVGGNPSPAKMLPYGCVNRVNVPNVPPAKGTTANCGATGQPACCVQAKSNMSNQVGFRAQLVAFDPKTGGGFNVGQNETTQTAGSGQSVNYTWYAGNIDAKTRKYIPIELGASNLMTPDPMNHYFHSLIAGLVVEPLGSKGWENAGTTALVNLADGSQFREFVVFTQDDLNLGNATDAVNYKSEPLFVLNAGASQPNPISRFCTQAACDAFRTTYQQNTGNGTTVVKQDVACMTAEAVTTGTPQQLWCVNVADANPACTQCSFTATTPTFNACAGESVRFRVLHPGGTNTNQVFEIFGHNWSEAPYMTEYDHCQAPTTQTNLFASQRQGTTNLCANQAYTLPTLSAAAQEEGQWQASLNAWQGSRMGHGPGNHFDILIPRAGGPFEKTGDYMYRSFPAMHFDLGLWGIFRVDNAQTNPALCPQQPRPDRALENQLPVGGGAR